MPRGRFSMLRSRLAGVQAVAAESGHSFARHSHDQFGLGLIDRGAQRSLSGRGTVEAGAGSVITCNPGEVHDGAPIGGERVWRMLYLDPALVADAVADMTEGRAGMAEFPDPVRRDARLADLVGRLHTAMTAPGEGTLRAEELLRLALAALIGDGAGGRARLPAGIGRARALLDEDPAAPVTLADLAAASGLSRYQVIRGFRAGLGLTPHAYLVQRRIDLARRHIAQGMGLAEASVAAGFADQSHMTRIFTAKYGLTPRAYAVALR